MSRRRQTPWIHQWSRPIIGAIAILGAINTAYITATKLLGGEAACPTTGCEQVLSSFYAEVFGIPLSLFGLIAYIAMAVFALAPLLVNPDTNKPLRNKLDNSTWLLLFIGATAMLVFSAYLMYIMVTEFVVPYGAGGICIYCIVSAVLAAAMFVLTILGRSWDDVGQLFFIGILVGLLVLVGTLGVYATQAKAVAGNGQVVDGQLPPEVTTVSGPAEIALAKHLKAVGAKVYSAYWCPHCYEQKLLFGREATEYLPYVECAPDGAYSQTEVCRSKPEVTGYPTWEINGQFYSGRQTLQKLAEYSGYQGSTEFRNNLGG